VLFSLKAAKLLANSLFVERHCKSYSFNRSAIGNVIKERHSHQTVLRLLCHLLLLVLLSCILVLSVGATIITTQ